MDVGRCEMLRWLLLGVRNFAVGVGEYEMSRWMLAGVKCYGGCWQV